MAVPTHPGTSREGLATPGLLSDAGSPERQWAKHPLPLLVWVHLCKLSQWPQTYKREGREGGEVSLDLMGENLEQKPHSEKEPGWPGDRQYQQISDPTGGDSGWGAAAGSLASPGSFLSSVGSHRLRARGGGPPDLRLGGATLPGARFPAGSPARRR